jgi:L,D-transpeptidase ErfK/SrfK
MIAKSSALKTRFAAQAVALTLAVAPVLAAPRDGDVIGEMSTTVTGSDDSLPEIARHFDLGFVELVAANPGLRPWAPGAGHELVLPTAHILPKAPRRGVVINLDEMRLYYYPASGGDPKTYPLGVGREGHVTPLGTSRIIGKAEQPTWYPPPSIRAEKPELPAVVPPGPDNPLGAYALYVGWPGIRIHGTNKPYGVGRRTSHGCIRLYPEDIEALYPQVPVGTPVTVVQQAVKVGWSGGDLYLEVHPSLAQADQLEDHGGTDPEPVPDALSLVRAAAGPEDDVRLDQEVIRRAAEERRGYPVRVTRNPPSPVGTSLP